ncbi:hypothetical protein B0H13DRAFT_2305188 [Mycena leptocephala]|nr:hypothetical protein B0H13DRAFT_2305188 [Mycena leptocephala]
MHRALGIPDITEMICAEVRPTLGIYEGRRSLAYLARVCRSLSELALDLLWAHQIRLTNLLACMPVDLWEVVQPDPKSKFVRARRAVEPDDWIRFHVYAPRIKHLSVHDGHCEPDTDDWSPVYEMLAASLPMDHLLPNLRSLSWTVHRMPWFSYGRLLLCPRLEYLVLGVIAIPAHLALLPTLPQRCPFLKSISVSTALGIDVSRRPLSLMIRGLTCLERTSVGSMDQAAFEHLARLATLEAFLVYSTPEFSLSFGANDLPKFPRLRELTFGSVSYEFLEAFIGMKDMWSLAEIDVNIVSAPTTRDTAQLFALLASKCDFASLTVLTLDFKADTEPLSLPQLASSVITFETLHPLLSFRALREVSLAPPAGVSLDDAGIEAIARAWPHLSALQLRGSRFRAPSSRVTLRGLRTVARHCQNLTSLSLPFDASVVPSIKDVPAAEQCDLGWIDVDDAVLADPEPVAAYLSAVFPNLHTTVTALQQKFTRVCESVPRSCIDGGRSWRGCFLTQEL